MDRIKKLKIKKQDGTFSDYVPIGADAENIDTTDGESVQLKLNKKPYYYDTVAAMKADTKLKIGDMAVTLGYYSVNDGGAAEYRIVENDNDNYCELLNNNLLAKIIIKKSMNIKQFGAKCDLNNNDSLNIQAAINSNCEEIIIDTSCLVAVTVAYKSAIEMKSNKTLTFKNNAYLKLNTNDFDGYFIINCKNIENFTINNPRLIGDKDTHIGVTGEWGHGLYINGCKNFNIFNPYISKTWGDGISLAYTDNSYFKNENGTLTNIIIKDVSRNGLHIEQGKNIYINKIYCDGVNRTNPKSGIDIEQDSTDKDFENIYINEIEIKDCPNGLNFNLNSSSSIATTEHNVSIRFNNVYLDNSSFKLFNFRSDYYKGFVEINNIILNNFNDFIYLQIKNNNFVKYIINNINILKQATRSENLLNDYSISIDSDGTPLKHLYINNLDIDEVNALPRYSIRFFVSQDFAVENNINIKIKSNKPMNIPNNVKGLNLNGSIIKLDIQDLYDIYNTGALWGFNLFAGTHYTNKKASRNLIGNFGSKFPIKNIPISLINENSTYKIGIENASGINFIPASEGFTNKIVSDEIGSELVFIYSEDFDSYCIKSKIGTWNNT